MEQTNVSTILVIEDNADDRFLLSRQLQKAQLDDHATFIDDGQDALDFLANIEHPPLAVFIDLQLPKVNGIEIMRYMKNNALLKEIPIIVLTASSNPKDLAACTELGAEAFLTKPVELATFIKTVAHLFPEK